MNTHSYKNIHQVKKGHLVLLVAFVLSVIVSTLGVHNAFAAQMTQTLVRFDRMQTSQFTSGTVCFKPTTASTSTSVAVTFPTGFTVSGTTANWTVNSTSTSWPTGGTAITGIATATSASGQTVTFPYTSATLSSSTLYCFNWTNTTTALQNPSGASSAETGTVALSNGDTSAYATSTVTNDQITVNATVPASFQFSLANTTDTFASLSTSSVNSSSTPPTATVNTNAKNGWQVWAKDANTGVKSVNAGNYTIPSKTPGSNATIAAGTEFFNTGLTSSQTSGTGTITIDPAFVGGSSGKGGGIDTTVRSLATSTGTANNAVLTLTNNITISTTTPPASDYTDTVTVTGAGLF